MWPWKRKHPEEIVLVKTEAESVYLLGTNKPDGTMVIHAYRNADAALDAQEKVKAANPRCCTWIIRPIVLDTPADGGFAK